MAVVWDISFFIGIITAVVGLWWAYPPLALITVGVALASFAVYKFKQASNVRRQSPADE